MLHFKTAIVLAGGKGTRLRETVPDLPKPLVNIVVFPFLDLVFNYLSDNGIKHVILSVGYKADLIVSRYGNDYLDVSISYAFETVPLGTGGAIKNALSYTKDQEVLVMNGDTLFTFDLLDFVKEHYQSNSNLTIALKEIENADRFGTAIVEGNYIIDFIAKGNKKRGCINGGIYLINRNWFEESTNGLKVFSFEMDILEKVVGKSPIRAYISNAFFIDIGIPEDYNKLNLLVAPLVEKWTLFLDRDGTINKQLPNDYVKSWNEFQFLPGALESLQLLSQLFEKVIVVTNQQGIAKGIMNESDLHNIHYLMNEAVSVAGGFIDQIYHCPDLASNNPYCRKPSPGMAYRAVREHKGVILKKSIMIGDSNSDMKFAKNGGMHAILLKPNFDKDSLILNCISYHSLFSFCQDLCQLKKLVVR